MRPLLFLCAALALLGSVACSAGPPAKEPIPRGRQVYAELGCGRCHVIDGQGGRVGPDLSHIGTAAATRKPGMSAKDYIRESILDPGAYVVPGYNDVMPRGLAMHLSQTDLDDLVEYLYSHE